MSTDDLDTRIRHLVADAIAGAPPAPMLDAHTLRPGGASTPSAPPAPFRLADRRRGWALAAAGALTAAAAVAAVIMINRDDRRLVPVGIDSTAPTVITAASTPPLPATVVPSSTPADSTTEVPATEVPATALQQSIVTAGADGVWQQTPTGPVQWTTEPMAVALLAPDGTMIVQRVTEYSSNADTATAADSLPLRIATPGAVPESFFGDAAEPVEGWYRLHDVAVVAGKPVMLYERQAAVSSGVETPPGELLLLDLTSGTLDTVATSWGGWESGSSRMHLSNNGFVVGEYYSEISRSFSLQYLLGDTDITAEELGVAPVYEDCSTCARLFTIDRAGNTIAWLDGTELVLWKRLDPSSSVTRIELGTTATVCFSDMTLGEGFVLLDRCDGGPDPRGSPLRVAFDGTFTALTGQTATVSA